MLFLTKMVFLVAASLNPAEILDEEELSLIEEVLAVDEDEIVDGEFLFIDPSSEEAYIAEDDSILHS